MNLKAPNSWTDPNEHFMKAIESPWYKLLIKLENLISSETRKFYEEKGIITMNLPITTGAISSPMGKGSDSSPVKINIGGLDTYLADSMQFLLEYGCRFNPKGVYYIMPSFRGELADERHLCQFYHSEVEISGNLEDIINLANEYVKFLAKKIVEKYGKELKENIGDISHIEKVANLKSPIPVITFDEFEKKIKEIYPHDVDKYIEYNQDFRNITKNGEQEIMKLYDGIVWISNYDQLAVPFYQQLSPNGKTTKNADLLMGIGETIGCGERNTTFEELMQSLKEHEILPKEYGWYLEMKKRYPLKTSGFGMGIERFLMWVLKCNDIRNMQICLRFNGIETTPKYNYNSIYHTGTPELSSKRLKLRRLKMSDAEDMFENWASDSEVTKYLTWDAHGSIDVTKSILKNWVKDYDKPDFYQWGIEDVENNELIGTISVVNKDDEKKEFELGVCLSKKYWGKKIALEAVNMVMKYLSSIGYKTMITTTKVGNEKCLNSIKKTDYEYLGIKKEGCTNLDGSKSDIHVFQKKLIR